MNRRTFNTAIALTPTLFASNLSSRIPDYQKKSLNAPRLNIGDTVGLIAPSGAISEEKIQTAIQNIAALGFKVQEGKHLRERYGYLAGTDEQRLEDLHSMYADKNVKAIWCVRGGYGCTRLLSSMDYDLIKKNKKILIGYSDITALLNAIYQETGVIGFHGPVASSTANDYNKLGFYNLLMSPTNNYKIEPFGEIMEKPYEPLQVFREGVGEGITAGGNLSLLAAMVGTKYEVEFKNKIVFIEDIGEEPYRIDRMLTQLIEGSDIKKAKAILLGQFRGCNPEDPEKSLSLVECLKDRLLPLNIPTMYGLNFGHVDHNFTFPIGAKARINTDGFVVEILEETVG